MNICEHISVRLRYWRFKCLKILNIQCHGVLFTATKGQSITRSNSVSIKFQIKCIISKQEQKINKQIKTI